MRIHRTLALLLVCFSLLVGCSSSPSPAFTPEPTLQAKAPSPKLSTTTAPTPQPTSLTGEPDPTASFTHSTPTSSPPLSADPFELVSQDSLFSFLEDLTAIQPYSGWRNSASQGESEALDYVENVLGGFEHLSSLGLELERQEFRVFLGTELWDTRLHLTVDGQETEVPADGLRGPRDEIGQALRFDSDGALNDSDRNPVVVEGPVVLVRSAEEIHALKKRDVQDRIVFLDYQAIDRVVQGGTRQAVQIAWDLLDESPTGLVLVTRNSNTVGESHGSFVGDNSALNSVETEAAPPILYVRLEDLSPAGIEDWDDLARIEGARLTWDADVFSPAPSGNLAARIPGADSSQAIILGAHIDSPNSPGALDDGSGSVVLLEVARVLDAARIQPPVDLYLVWFGSEELGLHGSAHFANTHQELLDRTVAMLQNDMLSYPLDGIYADLTLATWSYGRLGDGRMLWPEHVAKASAALGIETLIENYYYVYSDNSSFGGFDVPQADLIYQNGQRMEATGSLHYAAHIHDPYDTIELVRQKGDVLEEMVKVTLAGALDVPADLSDLRVAPRPDRRAVLVGSHTESPHMTPVGFTEFGMALAMEGFDVDLIPYGQAVTFADLADADLVIALPVVDYPGPESEPNLYDEAWTVQEISALEAYAASGGLLVLTNSANRLKYGNTILDANEDWEKVNALAEPFGVVYQDRTSTSTQAYPEQEHPLLAGISVVELAEANGIPFKLNEGIVLAQAGSEPAIALTTHGQGEVLVLADVGMLGATWGPPANLNFWRSLARYAR